VSTSPPIRAVVRALDLLRALNRQAVSSVDALYQQTRIPKPTIVRMLQTLEHSGLVKHAPQHGAYFLTSGVRQLAAGYHSEPMVVEAAANLMDQLTLRLKWPTAIAMLEDHAMVVRYSTIPLSPLAFKHSTINMRLSLASRAIGRAYLAHCSTEQQEALLAELAQSADPEDAPARDRASMHKQLTQVRTLGYALRDPQVLPVSNTLAVPVFDAHGVAASLGLTFFSSTLKPQQAVERYLPALQETAQQIGAQLRVLQST
jgi:IclR family transcriptional regulator, mhp operon transcriptional activator